MIYFRFYGGLGNQMFQYACANAVAEKFNTIVFWNDVGGSVFFKYFHRNRFRHIKTYNKFIRKGFQLSLTVLNGGKFCSVIETCNEPVFDMKNLFINKAYYDGYFQSEQYFNSLKKDISNYFTLKKKYRQEFERLYGKIFNKNKVLAIHCRLGEFTNWSLQGLGTNDFSMPQSYYTNALKNIENIEDYFIIVVTDDLTEAGKRFSFLERKIVVSNTAIVDFQVLMNADKLILANSTFSWWAGFLNKKASAIYAPEYWLGFNVRKEWPVDIIPEKFFKVPVFS